ncbi:MAG TPA: Ig-like domain-containing protein, partial [Baekduia sp.]
APTLALTRPQTGSTFTSTVNAAATATDRNGVSRVEFWVDGTRIASDKKAPYTASWSAPRSMSYSRHTLTVRAFDARGAVSSAAVSVTRVRSAHDARAHTRAVNVTDDWRVSSVSIAGATTQLEGASTAGDTMTVTYTRCGDASGKAIGTQKLRVNAAGRMSGTLPAGGVCVLKVA